MNYTPLHNHLHTSIGDSIGRPEDAIDRAKKLGMDTLALTDHGNMFGFVEFYELCKKNDIRPILGMEIYVAPQHSSIKTPENRKNYHAVLLAKNNQGLKNLIKICSISNSEQSFYYKPRLSLEEIAPYSEIL